MYRLGSDLAKLENNEPPIPAEIIQMQEALASPELITPDQAKLLWHTTAVKIFRNALTAKYIQSQWLAYIASADQGTFISESGLNLTQLPENWFMGLPINQVGEQIASSNELILAALFWQLFSSSPQSEYDQAYELMMNFGMHFQQFGSTLSSWAKINPRAAFMIRAVRTARVAVFGAPNLITNSNYATKQKLSSDQLRSAYTRTLHKSVNPLLRINFPAIDQLKEYITINDGSQLSPLAFVERGASDSYYLAIQPEIIEQVHLDLANFGDLPQVTGCPIIPGKNGDGYWRSIINGNDGALWTNAI
jgi:hypothetical protein